MTGFHILAPKTDNCETLKQFWLTPVLYSLCPKCFMRLWFNTPESIKSPYSKDLMTYKEDYSAINLAAVEQGQK